MSSAQVDEAWRALLEETLPADKREALQESYDAETDPQTRYNMLLEFSSYLRQVSHRAPAQALSLCKSTQSGLTTHPCHPCLECSQTATNHTMGGGDGSEDPYAVPRRGGVDARARGPQSRRRAKLRSRRTARPHGDPHRLSHRDGLLASRRVERASVASDAIVDQSWPGHAVCADAIVDQSGPGHAVCTSASGGDRHRGPIPFDKPGRDTTVPFVHATECDQPGSNDFASACAEATIRSEFRV